MPRFCGFASIAGTFDLVFCSSRPLRTSWLIVGMKPFTFFSYFTACIPAFLAAWKTNRLQTAKAPAETRPEPQEHRQCSALMPQDRDRHERIRSLSGL